MDSLTTSTSTCLRTLRVGARPGPLRSPESLHALSSWSLTSSTIFSSLSVKVMLVMGVTVGAPRPRQLCLVPTPPPKVRLPAREGASRIFCVERIEVRREPKRGVSQVLNRGKTMGRLVVTTATKVSLTAHDPASKAPLTGSCGWGIFLSVIHMRLGGCFLGLFFCVVVFFLLVGVFVVF